MKLLKTKGAVIGAVAALGLGAVTAAAANTPFGQSVTTHVTGCKSGDSNGIGQCVSDWVKAHNPGADHRNGGNKVKNPDTSPGQSGQEHGAGNSSNNGKAAEHQKPQPSPASEGHSDQSQGRGAEGKSDSPHGKAPQ